MSIIIPDGQDEAARMEARKEGGPSQGIQLSKGTFFYNFVSVFS